MRFEVRFVIGPTYGSGRWLSTFTCISFWFRPSNSQSPLVVARFSLISMGCLHFLLEKRVKVCGVLLKKTKCKCTNFNSNKIAGALPTVSYRSLCRNLYSIQICSTQRSSGIGRTDTILPAKAAPSGQAFEPIRRVLGSLHKVHAASGVRQRKLVTWISSLEKCLHILESTFDYSQTAVGSHW